MTIFRLLVLLILLFPAQLLSQGVQFGVDWKIPESINEQENQLKQYKELGIQVIQIEGVIDQTTISAIQSLGFELWISSGIKFLRSADYPIQQTLLDHLTDPLYYYRNNSITFDRYTLFEHPLKTGRFRSELSHYLQEVQEIYSGKIDILTTELDPDFDNSSIAFGHTIDTLDSTFVQNLLVETIDYFYVNNSSFSVNSARDLRDLLSIGEFKDKIWLFESDISETLESNPDLAKVIRGFSTNKNAVVALEPEIAEEDTLVVITITILILITLFIAIFTTNASYQRSIIRYLVTHNFFINDVMMKRTRLTGAVPLALLLSLLFSLLLIWITYDRMFNNVTTEMLLYHHPYIGNIISRGTISVISFSTLGLVLFQLISFLWVSAATFGKSSLAQVAQILLIPHQLIIPLTIIASLFYLNSSSPLILIASFGIFVIILLMSIPLTFIDILGQSQGKKGINWLLGPVLYMLLLTASLVYIFQYTSIPETLKLILMLS